MRGPRRCLHIVVALVLRLAASPEGAPLPQVPAGPKLELPDVKSVMTKAASKMGLFKAQTEALQATIAAKQRENEEAIGARRQRLEAQLTEQKHEIEQVALMNREVRRETKLVMQRNRDRRHEAMQVDRSNKVILDTIADLETKMRMAADFLADTMHSTEAVSTKESQVLASMDGKPTLSKFLSMADAVQQKHFTSPHSKPVTLLQHSPGVLDESEGFVQHLSQSLAEMVYAEQEGEAHILADFRKFSQEGTREYDRLVQEQIHLNETRLAAEKKSAELEEATQHVLRTHGMLRQRLHGVRLFVRKVDAEALETFHVAASEANNTETAPPV